MQRGIWGVGFIGSLALAAGLGAEPLGVCIRTPTTYRSIDLSMHRSISRVPQVPQVHQVPRVHQVHQVHQVPRVPQVHQVPQGQQQGQRGAQPPQGGRGGGGGRGAVAVMTLTTTAWNDGGMIPVKFSQAGEEASPPLAWTGLQTPATSYVLIVHDVDAMRGNEDTLHWMVWNIPGTATGLPERVPQGGQLADGSRQISATGPYYRGPGAPAAGPAHHYLFELYALDTMIDVQAVGASPADTRAAVVAAMAGHIRGKAALVGLFQRKAPLAWPPIR